MPTGVRELHRQYKCLSSLSITFWGMFVVHVETNEPDIHRQWHQEACLMQVGWGNPSEEEEEL